VASTVNWVTQASFEPPLVAVGVKVDSAAHEIAKESQAFALNVLGKGQQSLAFSFFKPLEREGDSIGGEAFTIGSSGSPILANAMAFIECTLVDTLERGDHSVFLGEVVESGVAREISGRPDAETLALGDLGDKVFYGG
jgi:flavin reductase (DIM6/NTAB) family NADH-FMN oxidoreductase RutF